MRVISGIVSVVITSTAVISWASKYEPRIPDEKLTQGALCSKSDPDFGGLRYKEKIAYCDRNVTATQKARIYDEYHIPVSKRHNYTIDHFIPLAIGGSNSPDNLWPEHRKIKQMRMDLEIDTFYDLEYGKITQKEAIAKIIHEKLNPPMPYAEQFEQ